MKTLSRVHDLDELLRRLRVLSEVSQARWGRMSAPQMVCHVGDAVRMATGEQPVTMHSNWRKRTLLKWLVLYVPVPWPPGVETSPEIDQVKGRGTRPGEFAADLARAESLLRRAARPEANLEGREHPVFGPMSHAEWMRWGYLHTDHHLRQFGA